MGIAAVGKVGRHEARVCGVVGAVAGADTEGELNLAALVEALAEEVGECGSYYTSVRCSNAVFVSRPDRDQDTNRDQDAPLLPSSMH